MGAMPIKSVSNSSSSIQTRFSMGLSMTDIAMIRKCWRPSEPYGEKVMERFCAQHPELRPTFRSPNSHSGKLQEFMESLMECIDSEDDCLAMVRKLGSKHADLAKLNATLYHTGYWSSLASTMAIVAGEVAGGEENARLWTIILFRVIFEMQVHFNRETSKVCFWHKAK